MGDPAVDTVSIPPTSRASGRASSSGSKEQSWLLFNFLHRNFAMCCMTGLYNPVRSCPSRDSNENLFRPSVFYKISHPVLLPVCSKCWPCSWYIRVNHNPNSRYCYRSGSSSADQPAKIFALLPITATASK
jgi:hypothetical protein